MRRRPLAAALATSCFVVVHQRQGFPVNNATKMLDWGLLQYLHRPVS